MSCERSTYPSRDGSPWPVFQSRATRRDPRSAVRLAARYGVEMPIAREVAAVLFEKRSPRRAAEALMARALKFE